MRFVFFVCSCVVCLILSACSAGVTIVGESPLEAGTYGGTDTCTLSVSIAGESISQQVSYPENVTISNAGLPFFEGVEVAAGVTGLSPEGAGVSGSQTVTSVITTTDAVTVESDISVTYDLGDGVLLPMGGSGTVVFAPAGDGAILESSSFALSGSSDELGFVFVSAVCNATLSSGPAEPNGPADQPGWDVFEDPTVGSVCGVVNVVSLEFAVRSCDGALVLITGPDEGFSNTFVTLEGDVLIDSRASGYIAYERDADGFFTLWWFSEDDFLIDFDDLISEPFESDALPSDFSNVACDAELLWEGDADCDTAFGNEIMRAVFIGGNG